MLEKTARIIRNTPGIIYGFTWISIALIHFSILYAVYDFGSLPALADSLVFNGLFAIFGTGLWFMVRYSDLKSKSPGEIIVYHLTGTALTVTVWISLGSYILNMLFRSNEAYTTFLSDSLYVRIISGVFYYALITTVYYLIINFRELQQKIEHELRLASLLKETELKALKSQIHPHFLFNSLNSISSLTITDPEKARAMLIKLSELMRYSLSLNDSLMTSLEKELYHTALYLDIEKVRFGDRLKFVKEVDESVLAWKLPALILQPLVENAVKHGVYEATETVTIKLQANLEEGLLRIRIENNYDEDASPKKGTGTGLKNVEGRLYSAFNQPGLMKVEKSHDLFIVILNIPLYE